LFLCSVNLYYDLLCIMAEQPGTAFSGKLLKGFYFFGSDALLHSQGFNFRRLFQYLY